MTTDIATRRDDHDDLFRIAASFAASGYFKDSKEEAQCVVKILAGREMGFGPFAAMSGVHIIEGKPAFSAGLMAAAITRGGRYRYRIREHTDQACAIEFLRGTESLGISRFTIEQAARASLAGRPIWKSYPRNMLWARAMSNGCRWYCADVFAGAVYTPEELGADVDADGSPVAPTPPVIHMLPPEPVVQPAQRTRSRDVPEGKRWSQSQLSWFFASLGDLRPRVTGDEVHAILGVESIHDWAGDLDAALARVRQARADMPTDMPPEAEDEESLGNLFDHPEGSIEAAWQRYNAVAKLALAWNKDYPEQPVKWPEPPRDGTAAQVRATAEGLERRLSKLLGTRGGAG